MYTQIDVESHFDGKLRIAYFDQPSKLNALTKPLLEDLKDFINDCNKDDSVRVVAISGKGKAFSAGQNLDDAFVQGKSHNDDYIVRTIVQEYYNPLVNAIVNCRKPVVSLVNGIAVGAGAMIAFVSDFAVAKESAIFSLGFSNIGLIPDTGGTYFLPKIVGRQMAHYLAFTNKKLTAKEALTHELVADVFSDEEYDAKCLELLENLANMPTTALSLTKKAFAESYNNTLSDQLDLEVKLQAKASKTDDFYEGVNAFLEKRKPEFTGK